MTYTIRFYFHHDYEGEPPDQAIISPEGKAVIGILDESPTCKLGGRTVEVEGIERWVGPWSWKPEDWEPSPLAARLLAFLNTPS